MGIPQRPVVAVVGGAKVSTKLDLLGNLVAKVDHLVIGGGMANTFLVAQGIEVANRWPNATWPQRRWRSWTRRRRRAARSTCRWISSWRASSRRGPQSEVVPVRACPADAMILDAGPATVAAAEAVFAAAKTLIWNGPLGAFEIAPFDAATVRRPGGGAADAGGQADLGGGRRRYGGGAEPGRGGGRFHLHLHRRGRVSGMDGGQGIARRHRFAQLIGIRAADAAC